MFTTRECKINGNYIVNNNTRAEFIDLWLSIGVQMPIGDRFHGCASRVSFDQFVGNELNCFRGTDVGISHKVYHMGICPVKFTNIADLVEKSLIDKKINDYDRLRV